MTVRPPIERLLDSIVFEEIPTKGIVHGNLPYATHRGVLSLGEGVEIVVFVLNDGQRVIDADSPLVAGLIEGITG